MKNLQDKVVVVTGAASGIGKALAAAFAKQNCHLALNDYNVEGLEQIVKELKAQSSQKIIGVPFDVSKKEAMQDFVKRVESDFGKADIMINNAGVALGKVSGENIELEDFEWLMGINFWGMVYGSKFFIPLLKQQKEAALVNVSSVFGLAGIPYQTAYCSSKFAIKGYTESLMQEAMLEYPHLVVHSVHPGGINTNIGKNSRKAPNVSEAEHKKLMTNFDKALITPPDELAEYVVKCVQQKRRRIIVGSKAGLVDFITRFFPNRYFNFILNEFKKTEGS